MTSPSLFSTLPDRDAQQLKLELAPSVSWSVDDYALTAANKDAFEGVMCWPEWPARGMVLQGERGAGKTHLAHVWAHKNGACFLRPRAWSMSSLPSHQPVVIEDVDQDGHDEEALFHVLNRVRAGEQDALITSRAEPVIWQHGRADITSRLRMLPVVRLLPPDMDTMTRLLCKQLADYDLALEPNLLAEAVKELPRSYAVLLSFVRCLADQTLGRQSKITRVRLAEALQRTLSY